MVIILTSNKVFWKKRTTYDYIIRWEGSVSPSHFTQDTFYAYVKKPIAPPVLNKMELLISSLILGMFIIFSYTILSCFSFDFISVIFGIIIAGVISNEGESTWSSNSNIGSDID